MPTAITGRDKEGSMHDATVDIRRVIKNLPVGFEIQHTGTCGVYGLEADVITECNTISK
jgi:hypothetical protein